MIATFRRLLLPALALSGMLIAVAAVLSASKPAPIAQPIAEPAIAPFANYIGGTGQTEPPGRTVAIGSAVGGIVTLVAVAPGDRVRAGDTLFQLDDRVERATRDQRVAELAEAEAQVAEMEASLADYRNQLRLADTVSDRRAVSVEDLAKRRYAVKVAEAKLASARAATESAKALLAQADTALARLTVAAPFDAEVLQVNLRPGEYASASALSTPLVMLGRTGALHVRVEIDENDAWRLRAGAAAKAYLRGNRNLSSALRFVHMEPYVTPKTSLTGDSSERVDTRVLQVVYAVEDPSLPVYAGQILDVFIEAPPLSADPHAAVAERGAP
ncbi:biotin/lipoyl-binding protein [Azospirillum sp. RWY-5-1]|uniref:Biotin/lipoyl-binding protein n=1 Tax=Azospirillum oleiclasticum TaxID=2735135 RepID=A0ABX2TEZ5_9PROT|nr:biotin/lipoyl-binding protein [Azospirillum oleiclasticum]NYZ15009.1 biotin/lipoyl-binding protein [Azospirillum oleiclasticum]NYZ22771.1 biotin/lipoyl-binding protein [Azospirillum oleiclasticum]